MDFYNMSLEEIEQVLKIKPINKNTLEFKISNEEKIFDEWEEVQDFLKKLKLQEIYNPTYSINVLGYEIYKEHYIKLYWNTYISNS